MEARLPQFDYVSYIYNGKIINKEELTEIQIKQLLFYLKETLR